MSHSFRPNFPSSMNTERILRVTNTFLWLTGYQVHWYEPKTQRLRISLWGLINFAMLGLFYTICFAHHFEPSGLLKTLQDITPFLRNMVRVQLLMGLKIFLFAIYEFRFVARAVNSLLDVLPRVFARKFSADEFFAYFLIFFTILVSLGFGLYIAVELHFKLPPMDHIFIASALFIPHFMLAGALRLYNVGCWLMCQELQRLCSDFEILWTEHAPALDTDKEQRSEVLTIITVPGETADCSALEKSLVQLQSRLQLLADVQKLYVETLQKQTALLIGLNTNCLLAGVYSLVYFKTTWYVLVDERHTRIFYAATYGIFVFILCDYLCWYMTQANFSKVKTCFEVSLRAAIKQRKQFPRTVRAILKDMLTQLYEEFTFKISGFNITSSNVVMLIVVTLFVIALTVVYQYLNDQIKSLVDRFDSFADDEDV